MLSFVLVVLSTAKVRKNGRRTKEIYFFFIGGKKFPYCAGESIHVERFPLTYDAYGISVATPFVLTNTESRRTLFKNDDLIQISSNKDILTYIVCILINYLLILHIMQQIH